MQIYRAEDGEVFEVNHTLRDIERLGSLERFLYDITGVEEDAILAYLSDGHRLRNENLRDLAGSVDQAIFVFNKHYLDYELDEVLDRLRIEASLQPEISNITSASVESLAATAVDHFDFISRVHGTIQVQHDALRIASTSLDLNVLSISDAFEGFAGNARRELEKQAGLLEGLELDLEVISKIRIHPEFLSPAVRRAVEAGEKARTLGDYVSNGKMRQVADACAKAHNELKKRFDAADSTMNQLTTGADEVRSAAVNPSLVEEARLCAKRAQEAFEHISDIKDQLREPRTDEDELYEELHKLDIVLRDEVQLIADLKNKSTATIIGALRHVSQLYNHLVSLPQALSTLQSEFRAKTNFSHIERLHKMLYAYGATLVEIVRRKEFSRFFSQKAQMIAEVMAKLTSNERKQRQIFRGEVHGQLPFDTKGIDDAVPAMEITSTGVGTCGYSIEREDLMMLLEEIDKMERSQNGSNGHLHVNSLGETRSRLEKLIMRMDGLETTFDKMVEKTIFSASRILLPRRHPTDHTDGEFQELVEQLHELQDIKSELERQFEEERHALQGEIDNLHTELRDVHSVATQQEGRTLQLDEELSRVRSIAEEESQRRSEAEERLTQREAEVERLREALAVADGRNLSQDQAFERLRHELVAVKNDAAANKRLEMEASEKLMQVISEKQLLSVSLEETQVREDKLKADVEFSRKETEDTRQSLKNTEEEHDRRMRTQVAEADRVLRDVIAEADGDRAVLEHQCVELAAASERTERQLKEARAELDVANADIAGLREELQRTEHELGTVRELEAERRQELETGLRKELDDSYAATFDTRKQLEDLQELAKTLLKVAVAFRDSYHKAYSVSQTSSSSKSISNLADSTFVKPFTEPPPIDLEDIATAVQVLSEYDPSSLPEAVTKMVSTIRKWQKQCKEYRDRAKAKISFRNFSKGDLALFLPTRNSVSKPWAAFNVSFPHYFLQASGNLAEQLKTREWIVARITSITEQVVDSKDPSTNPYGLVDGTKFYMLQVEDWTQSTSRRKSSPPHGADIPDNAAGGIESPPVTPTPTLSSTPFPVTESVGQPFNPATKKLQLGSRQRTHSAPAPAPSQGPSSLSRLLAKDTPTIEEVAERSGTPSPVRLSPSPSPARREPSPLARVTSPPLIHSPSPSGRPASPLVRPGSPLARPGSPLARPSSPLARPSSPRGSPTLRSLSGSRSSSPLATTIPVHAQPHPGSPLVNDRPHSSHTRTVSMPPPELPASATLTTPPLTSSHSRPIPSLTQPSPKSPATSLPQGNQLNPTSRRSSTSSRPGSASSMFSARHAFTKGSGQVKASPTTALSNPSGISLSGTNEEDIIAGIVTPSPEGSPSEGLSNVLLGRRRTTSTTSYAIGRSSPLSVPSGSRSQTSQGALASLADSLRLGKRPNRQSITGDGANVYAPGTSPVSGSLGGVGSLPPRASTSQSPKSPSSQQLGRSASLRPSGASELLRRYDDIHPQERGSR